jgi:hypothetical protein
LLGLHLVTIAIHQNQFRYLLIPTPLLLASATLLASRSARRPAAALWAAVLVSALLSASLARNARVLSLREASAVRSIQEWAAARLDRDKSVIVVGFRTWALQMGYALNPRQVIFVHENSTRDELERIRDLAEPGALLAAQPVAFLSGLGFEPADENELPSIFQGAQLFRPAEVRTRTITKKGAAVEPARREDLKL